MTSAIRDAPSVGNGCHHRAFGYEDGAVLWGFAPCSQEFPHGHTALDSCHGESHPFAEACACFRAAIPELLRAMPGYRWSQPLAQARYPNFPRAQSGPFASAFPRHLSTDHPAEVRFRAVDDLENCAVRGISIILISASRRPISVRRSPSPSCGSIPFLHILS